MQTGSICADTFQRSFFEFTFCEYKEEDMCHGPSFWVPSMFSRHVGCLLWWEPKALPLQQVKRVGIGIFQKFILDLSNTNSSPSGCLWVIITYILTNIKCSTCDFLLLTHVILSWTGLRSHPYMRACSWPRTRKLLPLLILSEATWEVYEHLIFFFYNSCLYRYFSFVFLCILKCVINWLYRQMTVLFAVLPSSPLAERCPKSLVLR